MRACELETATFAHFDDDFGLHLGGFRLASSQSGEAATGSMELLEEALAKRAR